MNSKLNLLETMKYVEKLGFECKKTGSNGQTRTGNNKIFERSRLECLEQKTGRSLFKSNQSRTKSNEKRTVRTGSIGRPSIRTAQKGGDPKKKWPSFRSIIHNLFLTSRWAFRLSSSLFSITIITKESFFKKIKQDVWEAQ